MTPPMLYYQPGGIAEKVLAHCTAIKQPFNPTVWAPNGHIQSAMGMLRTLSAKGSYKRQLVLTSDHGTLGLDWWGGADKPSYAAADAPVVLFIHGINGGSHEGYVKWACVAAASRGWRAVVLNMRGCNGLPLTSARGYNAINTADVHVAVQSIHSRFPAAPLMAVGYSLGSVLLAKYLAEADNGLYSRHETQQQQQQQQQQQPSGAAAVSDDSSSSSGQAPAAAPLRGSGLVGAALVSPPVCLHSTNSKMGKPNSMKFMYNLAVAYKLREYVKEHAASFQSLGVPIDTAAMLSSWTVGSFDDAVTLRLLGYPAPHIYYRHACSTNYIPHIRTPTLIMLSRDDPFLGMLPKEQVTANPFTLLAATRRGGHLAFLQGWWPLGASYCDEVIDDWLGSALQEWRHGCDAVLPRLDAAANSSSSSRWRHTPSRGQASAAAVGDGDLPSWVQRAVHGGWQPQQFDPSSLANIMCSCAPDADPLGRAHAADAVLNAATAPAQLAAAATGKAAGGAKQTRMFGFGGSKGDAGSAKGLRGDGAWAPFQDSSSSSSSGGRRWNSVSAAAAVNGFDAADAEFAGEVDAAVGAAEASVGRQAASGKQQQQPGQRQRLWRSKL
ncbi:hypothetical protein OEZ86_005239 [Tetradesmus obliquus]|nr:hypothetical protein OEZ86_005239 [Tetradesmus obliquus]